MPTLIDKPTVVAAVGNKPKRIEELIGRVNTGETGVEYMPVCIPALSPQMVHRDTGLRGPRRESFRAHRRTDPYGERGLLHASVG